MHGRAIWRLFFGVALIAVVVGCRGRSSKRIADQLPPSTVVQDTQEQRPDTEPSTSTATTLPTTEPTPSPVPVSPTSKPTDAPPPTQEPSPTLTTTALPSPTPAPPTIVPKKRVASSEADNQACIDCHTDKNALRRLAKEPEHSESLSTGEG